MPAGRPQRTGQNGRQLIRERFLQLRCSDMMHGVCRWLLERAPRPENVLAGIDDPESTAKNAVGDYGLQEW